MAVQTPRKSRVLIVDDNRDHLSMLATLLRALDQDVQVASSGSAALWLAAAFKPEFVFLDLAMPQMSGYEVAAELRKLPTTKNAKIVAISGAKIETQERAQQAGCDLFLRKPASLAQISAVFDS